MRTDWQHFLAQQGGHIAHGRLLDFGDPQAERAAAECSVLSSGTVVTDLSGFGLLSCSGEDAAKFLHSQLSNDITGLAADASLYAAYCSAKGRMLANFLVWQMAGRFVLLLPDALLASLRQRLGMFVLRARARIEDASDDYVRIGIAGTQAAAILRDVAGPVPPAPHQVAQLDAGALIRLEQQRFLLVLEPAAAPALWQALAARCTAVGSGCWEWLDIRAGIPWLGNATQGQFVPQMANLELIGGVSFKKGCYPGQEIVARTQYLGQVKRRMVLARIASGAAPAAGDALFGTDNGDQANGMIVNVQAAPDGGYDVLAVVQTASLDGGVHLHSLAGPVLAILPLPYAS